MAKFCPMFSGSSGNSTYIGTSDGGILVDVGVSAARTKRALEAMGTDVDSIKAIFVTHSHSDHIGGIRVLASRNHIPVYLTADTLEGIKNAGEFSEKVDYRLLGDNSVELDFAKVSHFATSHDCKGSCGYVIDLGDRKIAVCTDLGYVSNEVHSAIAGCDLVMIESNHDVKMLQNNPAYPFHLKRRILGDEGHLSNNCCANEVLKLLNGGSTRFVLAHLSRQNNMPTLAKETTRAMLESVGAKENIDYILSVASPQENGMIIL